MTTIQVLLVYIFVCFCLKCDSRQCRFRTGCAFVWCKLLGIHNLRSTGQNVFFSQCSTLALRHHVELVCPSTSFISTRRTESRSNFQVLFKEMFWDVCGGCVSRGYNEDCQLRNVCLPVLAVCPLKQHTQKLFCHVTWRTALKTETASSSETLVISRMTGICISINVRTHSLAVSSFHCAEHCSLLQSREVGGNGWILTASQGGV